MAWHSTWNEPERRPMFMGRGTTPLGVTLVLVVTIGVHVVDLLTHRSLTRLGDLSVVALMQGQLWRLVTYMFLHGDLFWHIGINMFVLWMFGVVLERQLGTRQFLILYFLSGLVGGLMDIAFNLVMSRLYGIVLFVQPDGQIVQALNFLHVPAVGASAGVAGVLVAFAVLNPRELVYIFGLIPIEAIWLAICYVVYESIPIFQAFFQARFDNTAHAAHLGGMVTGYLWVKYGASIAGWLIWRERHAETSYLRRSPERDAEEQAEADRILDKIHTHGLNSLTLREKLFLQEITRRGRRRG